VDQNVSDNLPAYPRERNFLHPWNDLGLLFVHKEQRFPALKGLSDAIVSPRIFEDSIFVSDEIFRYMDGHDNLCYGSWIGLPLPRLEQLQIPTVKRLLHSFLAKRLVGCHFLGNLRF
jgi:hypothetical protein